MLFVFATGFHLFFWSWGYVVLSELKLDDGGRDVPGGNENAVTILGVEKTTTVFNKVVSVFKKSFLNHLMIAMVSDEVGAALEDEATWLFAPLFFLVER